MKKYFIDVFITHCDDYLIETFIKETNNISKYLKEEYPSNIWIKDYVDRALKYGSCEEFVEDNYFFARLRILECTDKEYEILNKFIFKIEDLYDMV